MTLRALRAACAVGSFALLPALAGAQDAKPVSVGVMGGLSLPMGDLSDGFDSGYNITGSVYLRPSASRLTFRGDIGYDALAGKSVIPDLSVLSVTGNVIFPIGMNPAEGSIRPYVIGGGGLYRTSQDNVAGGGSSSDSNFGIAAGGGLEFLLSGFTTFAEARFVNVFTDGDSSRWVPITFGIRF